ncbi:MAG: InlB B-repeat-containing protein [Bacilli bacterium]|nr:InlB B-repeat-containing protein [Bacilli bacterium]
MPIYNEDENLNFEFGHTQDSESTSYDDNSDRIRDGLNDDKIANESTSQGESKKKQTKKKPKEENKSDKDGPSNSGNAGTTGSSLPTSVVTIVGAASVTVTTLSTLIGVNLFFNAKCQMNHVEPTSDSIVYELDLTDINQDECIIELSHDAYKDTKPLTEGKNAGEFTHLTPSTAYTVSVIDVTYNNYVFYSEVISTTPEQRFTITFDANGGSGTMSSVTLGIGEPYTLPECDFTYVGMSFTYWTVNNDTEKQYHPGDKLSLTEDAVIKANWEQLCTISFDPNGGTGTMDPVSMPISETYIIPACDFTYEGMDFTYWTVNNDTEKHYNPGDELSLTGNTVLKANWATKLCTITFVANNGTEETKDPIVLDYNTYFTMPECPFSDPDAHKMFAGWLLDDDTEPMQEASWYVKGDHVLTAAWQDCYVVTYVDEINDITYIDKVPTEDPSYTFLDTWTGVPPTDCYLYSWIDEDENEIALGESRVLSGDVTVSASYLSNGTNFIYFDANGGSGTMKTVKTTDAAPKAPECTLTAPEGFVFDHWTVKDEDPANEYYPGDTLSLAGKETTLLAEWLPDASFKFHIDYLDTQSDEPTNELHSTVTFVDNGGKYVNGEFEIEFVSGDGNSVTIENVTFEAASKAAYSLDLTDYMDFFSNYDLMDYYVYGYAMMGDEKVRVNPIRGSVNQYQLQKTVFRGVYVDGVKLEDGATVPYYMRNGNPRLPIYYDYSDYNNEAYGTLLSLNGDQAPCSHGMLNFDANQAVNSGTFTLVSTKQETDVTLASYQNLTYTPVSTDVARIFGFQLYERSLFYFEDNMEHLIVSLTGVGVNSGSDISDLTFSDFRLVITPKTANGALTHLGNEVSFEIPFTPDPNEYIATQVWIPVEDTAALKKYFTHYLLDVKVVYHDDVDDRDLEVTQYTNYTFAYAG